MPTYTYECPGCGDVRDIERKINDPEDTYICNQCHCQFIRKWDVPSIVFNGPGFYKTDNAK